MLIYAKHVSGSCLDSLALKELIVHGVNQVWCFEDIQLEECARE